MTFDNPDGMALEQVLRDSRCRLKCLDEAGNPLPAERWKDVARFTGRAVNYPAHMGIDATYREISCNCCEGYLRPVSLKDYSEDDALARFGMKAIPVGVTLYECVICDYQMKAGTGINR